MIIKSTLIGSCKVGKTYFLDNIVKRKNPGKYIPTIGVDYAVYNYNSYKLCIWDTSGNDRFSSILKKFILNSSVLICIYKDWKSYDYILRLLKKIDLSSVNKIFFINFGKIDGYFEVENVKLYYLNCDLSDPQSCVDCIKVLINICSKKKSTQMYSKKKREWCSFWV